MSPLELAILMHYYWSPNDFRDGDFTAPMVRATIERFRDQDELLCLNHGGVGDATYKLTQRGRVFLDHLMAQPLPVQAWVMPNVDRGGEHG